MRLLFLGDVMGRSGRKVIQEKLPRLREDLKLDVVVTNCENMAGGFGITPATVDDMFDAGVDVPEGEGHRRQESV